ncbi:MAG: hypothetical protein JXK94_05865 [Deltaproteobacteria bacterium]|nr:hypothetical protein [Deltaproteobacteria bacterium]
MGILDYFKPISSWSAEKVRKFLQENKPEAYNLLDVRQPKEYTREHLPGAILVPMSDLPEKMKELDPEKPTITYCGIGVRSRAAASMLSHAGFRQVYSLEGGIKAWNGVVAEGEPEMGMAYFEPARSIEEFIGLAWLIESATQSFYLKMAERFQNTEAEPFFNQMGFIEERHQAFLEVLLEKISHQEKDENFPQSLLPSLPPEPVMEGGIKLKDALAWAESHDLGEILQMAISFESNAYDRYLLMIPKMEDDETRDLFRVLAEEEKAHLSHLSNYLDKILARS